MAREEMAAITEEAVRRSGIAEAYIRHVITRGVGDLGLDPRKCPKPSVVIIVDTIKLWPEQVYEAGLNVVTAGTPIPQRESLSPRVKSLNYLAHILAKIEGIHAGADEVLDTASGEWRAAVKAATGGRGVDVAIEALGEQATFGARGGFLLSIGPTDSVR
jgi:branched-subunit amino acid aminotransferase/4-amino-4-deoxychorismate lyase